MNLLNLQEDEKLKTIKVKGYNFTIRFITPLDRVKIAQQRMRLQGGNPIDAMANEDFIFFENIAINDHCIEESPEDFEDYESCVSWDDIEIINGVAGEIKKHTNDIESKLKKNKPIIGGTE
jgi:hypothetical protein